MKQIRQYISHVLVDLIAKYGIESFIMNSNIITRITSPKVYIHTE